MEKKDKNFTWTDEEVSLLLGVILDYKTAIKDWIGKQLKINMKI